MDKQRLQELAGVEQLDEIAGYGGSFGKQKSPEAEAIGIVLSNLRTMKMALEQGNMEAVNEELDKAMTMLARLKSKQ